MAHSFPYSYKHSFLWCLLLSLGTYAAVLVDFQVAQPPPLPSGAKQCTVQILQWVSEFVFNINCPDYMPTFPGGPLGFRSAGTRRLSPV